MKTICLSVPDKVYDIIEHYIGYFSTTRSRFVSSCIYELAELCDVFAFDFFGHLVSVPFIRSFASWSSGAEPPVPVLESSGVLEFLDSESLFTQALKAKNKSIKGGHKK